MHVAIIGPEASGKTELARYLAQQFNGVATEEYARIYFAKRKLQANHVLTPQEMCEVMQGQLSLEQGDGLRFIDASTVHGPLYTALRMEESGIYFDFSSVSAEIMRHGADGNYDAFLLCMPRAEDDWVEDGARAMPEITDRLAFARACEDFVIRYYPDKPLMKIDAPDWESRRQQAVKAMQKWITS